MANEANDQIEKQGYFIPGNIAKDIFTQFAIDNNLDFHENTVDGTTTHGTTHIIYQYPNDATRENQSSTKCIPLQKNPVQ